MYRLLIMVLLCVVVHGAENIGLELTLVNGLHQGTPTPQSPNLMMDLECNGGTWERVWANARNFNIAIHWGRVTTAAVSADAVELELAMRIEDDSWIQGGRATYRLTMGRTADGSLEGTYQARFNNHDYKGRVFGRVKPPRTIEPGFVPVAPGEHPRLIMRKADVPRLRELAKTPFGQAVLAALPIGLPTGKDDKPDAVGLGVRYQLTGDPALAELCRQAVQWHMNDTSTPAFARGRQWGARLEQVSVGFDLCCDAWTQDFRKQVASYLRFTSNTIFFDPLKVGRAINWSIGSNYAGPIYAGVAFAGLALVGEPGPEPTRPQPPSAVDEIAPATNYTPPAGVPVVPLPMGNAARAWLTASVGFGMSNDPMEGLDWADLRPAPGTMITIDETETAFAILEAKHIMTDAANPARGGINLKSGHLATGKTFTLVGYNVVQVDAPAQVKLRAPSSKSGRVQVVLNGHHLADGQVVELTPGLYPFLVCMRLPAGLWGSLEPWFEAATPDDLAASAKRLDIATADYAEKLKDWEFDVASWKENGNRDVQFEKVNEMGRRMMYLFCREACGDGGYQTESGHYFEDAIDGPARYAHAYRNVYGHRLSGFDDLTAFNPRKLMAKILLDAMPDAKKPEFIEQKINYSYGETAVIRTLAELYPQIDARYRPALLWHWNREAGGDPLKPDWAQLVRNSPAYCLVNYPVDASGTTPRDPVAHPRETMPLTWAADDFGYYIFRNGWNGPAKDVVVQCFAKQRGSQGWGGPDSGTFRIWGLGSEWAGGNTDREARRWLENVIALPEDGLTEGACGKVIHRDLRPDGSGSISIDTALQFYTKDEKGAADTGPRAERYSGYYHPGTKAPVVKDPLRAIAVDYSGNSGATMLFSVLDRIDGGGLKEWYWQVDSARVTVEGNRFVIAGADGFSLRVTFITPAELAIVAQKEERKITKSAGGGGGKTQLSRNINAVKASGTDPKAGRFWAVATLAKGEHPAVAITGSGLDATVSVGGQTLRFDGTKLVMGK